MKETIDYQQLRIEALQEENARLWVLLDQTAEVVAKANKEMRYYLNYDKPLSELNKTY